MVWTEFLTTPPRLRELRLLRNFFLIAQPPPAEEGSSPGTYPVLARAHTSSQLDNDESGPDFPLMLATKPAVFP